MDLDTIRTRALTLMAKHGLLKAGWTFKFTNSRTMHGYAQTKVNRATGKIIRKSLALSSYFSLKVQPADLDNTILHEIAHCLDFERNGKMCGHGAPWKAICVEIGAKPVRLYKGEKVRPEFVLKYEDQIVAEYHRMPKNLLARLPTMQVKNRPETLGKLKLFRVKPKIKE